MGDDEDAVDALIERANMPLNEDLDAAVPILRTADPIPSTVSTFVPLPPTTTPVVLIPPPQTPLKPKLSNKAIIGISVGAAVVVAAVIGLLLYFLYFAKQAGPNNGAATFGTITVQDSTTNVQTNAFAPGDTLLLAYVPSAAGFSNQALWSLSLDGGKTYSVHIDDTSEVNAVQWQIPKDTYTLNAVFRVQDANTPGDFVTTLPQTITILPATSLTSGPGVTGPGQNITAGTSVTTVIAIDTELKGISTTSWSVVLTNDPKFKNGLTVATLTSVTLGVDTVTLVWTTTKVQSGVLYRISTTDLVQNGYPAELFVTVPNTVDVIAGVECSGSPPPSGNLVLCQLAMRAADGRSGAFTPTESVILDVAYQNTYPASAATITYDAGAGAVAWTMASGPTLHNGVATYSALLPDLITATFVISISAGVPVSSVSSITYAIQPSIMINGLPVGSHVKVFQSYVHLFPTTCTFTVSPATFTGFSTTVGWSNLDGGRFVAGASGTVLRTRSLGSGVYELTWQLTQADFVGFQTGTINRLFWVVLNGTYKQSVNVFFDIQSYVPVWSTIYRLSVGTPAAAPKYVNDPESAISLTLLSHYSTWAIVPSAQTALSSIQSATLDGATVWFSDTISNLNPGGAGRDVFAGPGATPSQAQVWTIAPAPAPFAACNAMTLHATTGGFVTTHADPYNLVFMAFNPNQPIDATTVFIWPNSGIPFAADEC